MPEPRRLLGVMVPDRHRAVAAEMFELFKTPWEPVRDGVEYEVILAHAETASREGTRLTIVTGGPSVIDEAWGIAAAPLSPAGEIEAAGISIALLRPWLPLGESDAGWFWSCSDRLRLGYDLFAEIEALLTSGQEGEAALQATVGRHLEILKLAMLAVGMPVVEVDAAPEDATLTVALTHDVDFARLRDHRFDRTAAGFLYRATLGTVVDFVRGRARLSKVGRNLAAALKLPLVHLGWVSDPWNCFGAYGALERRWGATFYVVPRRDDPGKALPRRRVDPGRACRYQASDVAAELAALEKAGFEIGLHGLDAWAGAGEATTERAAIEAASGADVAGVRMHWLYFSAESYRALDEAGFDYDSTLGHNDAIGFRAGTGQAFRPLDVDHLLELPLAVQDTALFAGKRLGLDEEQASSLCARVIAEARAYGGGLTLLWHQRSLAPERCWGGFYVKLLQRLENEGAWLAPAAEVVRLYRRRRGVRLEASIDGGALTILPYAEGGVDARLRLRVRLPGGSAPLRFPVEARTFPLAVPS